MNKILVNVYVPVLGESFDVFIPQNDLIFDVTGLIKKAVAQISDGEFIPGRSCTLAYRLSGEIIDIDKSVKELQIHNGSKLMLI